MAGLPYSAKNLAGRALQLTQAAGPGGAGRLLPRFMHNSARAGGELPPTSRELSSVERAHLYRNLRKIHHKREELYDLSASLQRYYSIPSSIGRSNSVLLKNLASQVDVRPTDPLWLMFRASRRINKLLRLSAAAASVYVFVTTKFPKDEE